MSEKVLPAQSGNATVATMSEAPHTPEPWAIASTEPQEVRSDPVYGRAVASTSICGITPDERSANAARIVECVNACAGMADPAAEIQMLKLARERAFDTADSALDAEAERDSLRRDVAALLNALPDSAHDVAEGVVKIAAMRDAMKEALEALLHYFDECPNCGGAGQDNDGEGLLPEECPQCRPSLAALAKLQPFIQPFIKP